MCENVPDDVLLYVFSYLDAISLTKVRRVCHRWNALATDEILWKHKLLQDISNWKQISSAAVQENDVLSEGETGCERYLKSCPDIIKMRRALIRNNTLHQLTSFLRSMLPIQRYGIGLSGLQINDVNTELQKYDAANPVEHCGQFPGLFKGAGGGMKYLFKPPDSSTQFMLELSILHMATKQQRQSKSRQEMAAVFAEKMSSEGSREMLEYFKAYIHTISATILESKTVEDTLKDIECHQQELSVLDEKLLSGVPILILCVTRKESYKKIKPYQITEKLNMKSLKRPWLVAECCLEMLFRDIVDPFSWIVKTLNSKPF